MSETQAGSESWLLRTEPNLERWSVEVREIVRGNREDFVVYFGSAPEYVRSLIFTSRDPSSAEYLFDKALRELAESWHPLENPDTERDLLTLQLLGAFTPEPGMGKTLDFLRGVNALDQADGNARVERLKPVALQVMEQYFPVEQAPAGAFAEYVVQLEVNLTLPEYAIYAIARLHELRRLHVGDPRVGTLIEGAPQLLPALLPVFVTRMPRDWENLDQISALYRHCLHAAAAPAALSELKSAVKSLGFYLVDDPQMGPCLESASGSSRQELPLDDGDLRLYYTKIFFSLEQIAVDTKLAQIERQASHEEPPVSFQLPLESAA